MLLCEAWQLVEKRARAEGGRVPEQALVRLMGEAVRDDGAALGNDGFAEFARSLACEQ